MKIYGQKFKHQAFFVCAGVNSDRYWQKFSFLVYFFLSGRHESVLRWNKKSKTYVIESKPLVHEIKIVTASSLKVAKPSVFCLCPSMSQAEPEFINV